MSEKDKTNKILSITIDNFSEYIEVSKARRNKPYIQGKCRVPKKYSGSNYHWIKRGKVFILAEATVTGFIPLIANSKTAGTPKYKKVNGQDIFNQRLDPFARAALVKKIHNYFIPYLKDIPNFNIEDYPVSVELEFYIKDQGKYNIDDDNRWLWMKCFKDTLTELKKWEDDNVYVTNGSSTKTILIPEDQKQKLVINIYGSR